MAKLDEMYYDMTREFIAGAQRKASDGRPTAVVEVLESLKNVSPEHAKVLAEYLDRLEQTLDGDE